MSRLGALRYVYMGSSDVHEDVRFHVETLGGELRWFIDRFGAEVACVRYHGDTDLVFASHMKRGRAIHLFEVNDLSSFTNLAGSTRMETPVGPAVVFGNTQAIRMGAITVTSTDRLETVWAEAENPHAIRPEFAIKRAVPSDGHRSVILARSLPTA